MCLLSVFNVISVSLSLSLSFIRRISVWIPGQYLTTEISPDITSVDQVLTLVLSCFGPPADDGKRALRDLLSALGHAHQGSTGEGQDVQCD